MEQDLLKTNIANLQADDVALVSYPGSGSSLLGGILLELGIDYIEGYQEKILPSKRKTIVKNAFWRPHWQQLADKYNRKLISDDALRVIKAHCYPDAFSGSALRKTIFLVRDARDAVLSYYNWRLGFSDETGTLHDFLNRKGVFDRAPFDDWGAYCAA